MTSTSNNKTYIITGQLHSGKTTFISKVANGLTNTLNVCGIIAHGNFKNGRRWSFTVEHLPSGQRRMLAIAAHRERWISMGRFCFDPETFQWGNRLVINNLESSQICIVDEPGPLEMKGEGWAPIINECTSRKDIIPLFVLRETLVQPFVSKYKLHRAVIHHIDSTKPTDIISKIIQNC